MKLSELRRLREFRHAPAQPALLPIAVWLGVIVGAICGFAVGLMFGVILVPL